MQDPNWKPHTESNYRQHQMQTMRKMVVVSVTSMNDNRRLRNGGTSAAAATSNAAHTPIRLSGAPRFVLRAHSGIKNLIAMFTL
jgi:hypothetical protein